MTTNTYKRPQKWLSEYLDSCTSLIAHNWVFYTSKNYFKEQTLKTLRVLLFAWTIWMGCCEEHAGLSFPTTNTAVWVKLISSTEEHYQPFILCFLKLNPNLSPFLLYSQLLQTFYLGIWVFGATGISVLATVAPKGLKTAY